MKIEYVEYDLDAVIRYFAEGYDTDKLKLQNWEAFIDTNKKKVIFKLFYEDKKK